MHGAVGREIIPLCRAKRRIEQAFLNNCPQLTSRQTLHGYPVAISSETGSSFAARVPHEIKWYPARRPKANRRTSGRVFTQCQREVPLSLPVWYHPTFFRRIDPAVPPRHGTEPFVREAIFSSFCFRKSIRHLNLVVVKEPQHILRLSSVQHRYGGKHRFRLFRRCHPLLCGSALIHMAQVFSRCFLYR